MADSKVDLTNESGDHAVQTYVDGNSDTVFASNVCLVEADGTKVAQVRQEKQLIDDYTNATHEYFCSAPFGTATSAAAWKIQRLTLATGLLEAADGNLDYDNVADNRVSLSYS